jgi:hypothetical protein
MSLEMIWREVPPLPHAGDDDCEHDWTPQPETRTDPLGGGDVVVYDCMFCDAVHIERPALTRVVDWRERRYALGR